MQQRSSPFHDQHCELARKHARTTPVRPTWWLQAAKEHTKGVDTGETQTSDADLVWVSEAEAFLVPLNLVRLLIAAR